MLILGLLIIAGLGTYRGFKYGAGSRRFFGLLPIVLLVVGGVIIPFVVGGMRGAGIETQVAGLGQGELVLVAVVGSLLLAAVSGAVLSLVFRPPRR